jgi:hypothetical protein
MSFSFKPAVSAFLLPGQGKHPRMSKSLKTFVAALLLIVTALGYMLTRNSAKPAWDGSALLAKAEQSLEGLPAKEAEAIRALLVSAGQSRYEDRTSAWMKSSLKDELMPVADYAMASLRAMAATGDAEAMWYLHFVLTQRVATGDEGFEWLEKSARLGYPRAVFDVTSHKLRNQPEQLRAAMESMSKQEDEAGLQALYWFAFGYEKGQDGLPKDAAKAADYRQRAKALGDKLRPAASSK